MVSDILKKLRKENGKTQQEIADILSIDRSAYTRYERGSRRPPYEVLLKISDYYNVTIDYLFGNILNQKDSNALKEQPPNELQGLSIEFIKLARELQQKGYNPDDIRKIIKTIEDVSKKDS